MPSRTPSEKLAWDCKVTAGARFNAANRLRSRERGSNILVSVYSAFLICVSVATLSLPLSSNLIRYASFGGIVASVLVLVMSMRNYAHQYGVEAEQMHRCALEINELKRRIESHDPATVLSMLPEYSRDYSNILQKWSLNHEQKDFLDYKYRHKWEFDDIEDVTDDKLSDKRFKETYDVSAGAVALMSLIGAGLVILVVYVLWTMVEPDANSSDLNAMIEQSIQNVENAAGSVK